MAKKDKDTEPEEKEDLSDGSVAVNDAWTGMLAISLLALGIASALLAWDYMKYDETIPKASSVIGTAPKALPPPTPAADDKGKKGDPKKGQ